jgi:hypothetical protein
MAVAVDAQGIAHPPTSDLSDLGGTSRRLAKLVLEHGDFEFEGFGWLQGTFGSIASHLGVNEKTIQRIAGKPPFRYIVRRTEERGKHILLRLGLEPCESDLVHRLRSTWVRGLTYFNEAAAKAWPIDAMRAKEAGLPYERLLERAKKAREWETVTAKLKKGERISYSVRPHEMGLLRQCAKRLGDDAFATVACLTSWNGWHRFMAYAKIADRVNDRHYHWPALGPISANPDVALQTYLDIRQEEGKATLAESARLNAKIASLTP